MHAGFIYRSHVADRRRKIDYLCVHLICVHIKSSQLEFTIIIYSNFINLCKLGINVYTEQSVKKGFYKIKCNILLELIILY